MRSRFTFSMLGVLILIGGIVLITGSFADEVYQNMTIDDPVWHFHVNNTSSGQSGPLTASQSVARGIAETKSSTGAWFLSLSGDVKVYNPCTDIEGIDATLNTPLEVGEYIFTGASGIAVIRISDSLSVTLRPNSELLIGEEPPCAAPSEINEQLPPISQAEGGGQEISPWESPSTDYWQKVSGTGWMEYPIPSPGPTSGTWETTPELTESPPEYSPEMPVTSGCDWSGSWSTSYGQMTVSQVGSSVSGSYEHNNGKILGTVEGNEFTGTWQESTDSAIYTGPLDLVMNDDCTSFSGHWKYSSSDSWNGEWSGSRG